MWDFQTPRACFDLGAGTLALQLIWRSNDEETGAWNWRKGLIRGNRTICNHNIHRLAFVFVLTSLGRSSYLSCLSAKLNLRLVRLSKWYKFLIIQYLPSLPCINSVIRMKDVNLNKAEVLYFEMRCSARWAQIRCCNINTSAIRTILGEGRLRDVGSRKSENTRGGALPQDRCPNREPLGLH